MFSHEKEKTYLNKKTGANNRPVDVSVSKLTDKKLDKLAEQYAREYYPGEDRFDLNYRAVVKENFIHIAEYLKQFGH
jgi:hypothetical protein